MGNADRQIGRHSWLQAAEADVGADTTLFGGFVFWSPVGSLAKVFIAQKGG